MLEVIHEYWWLITGAIVPIVGWLYKKSMKYHKELDERMSSIELLNRTQNAALLASTRTTLLEIMEKAIEKGYATKYQKMVTYELKKSYNELGGDSFIDEMYENEYIPLPDTREN